MSISLASRFERTLSTLLVSLSIGFFLLLISLLIQHFFYVTIIVLSATMCVSLITVIRTFLKERRHEIFDISKPTQLESGLLAFKSPMKRSAVFFAFNIRTKNVEKSRFRRTITILLKILPSSTIFALEWTAKKECLVNFYIKLEKSSFLTQARELLNNITKSFNNALGNQNVRLLDGDELMSHFSMGIPGRLHRVSISGRYGITIQTDITKTKRLFARLTPTSVNSINTVLSQIGNTQEFRMILPYIITNNSTIMSESFTLVFEAPSTLNQVQKNKPESDSLNLIPSLETIRMFGDVLSRNQMSDPKIELPFAEAATRILDLLLTPWALHRESEEGPRHPPNPEVKPIETRMWREYLVEELSSSNLSYQKDKVLFIDRMPLRVDAQVSDLSILVIPKVKEEHVKWLIQNIITLLEMNRSKSVILLMTQPQNTILTHPKLSEFNKSRRIHFVSTKEELASLLKEKKTHQLKRQKELAQVA